VGGTGVNGNCGMRTVEVGVMKQTFFLISLGDGCDMKTGLCNMLADAESPD